MDWKQKIIKKYNEAKSYICFVIHHFIEDDCTYRASALAFTSLLAIVPLMSVGLAILSIFPVFQHLAGPIQDFIFENFVPATGKIVQNYLQIFVLQVFRLSTFGILFLFVTALLMMYTIERSMNKIWRVSTPRKGASAFLLYWAILSLGPIFLGLSLAISSYIFSMPLIHDFSIPFFINYIPSLLSLIGFTLLYIIVPNCKVHFRYAVYGAFFATILFEIAKQAFAWFLIRYNNYQLLYGAFAFIPIFFIWIYWVWLISLLGAEICYASSVHYQRRAGPQLDGFSHFLLWLHKFWLAHQQGNSVSLDELINVCNKPFAVEIGEMIHTLSSLGFIKMTNNGNYVLSRDLSELSLFDVIQTLPYRLPSLHELRHNEKNLQKPWIQLMENAEVELQHTFSMSIEDLFKKSQSTRFLKNKSS